MSFEALIIALKGGPKSGNWGHSGRPGKIGGSTSGGGHTRIGISKPDVYSHEEIQDRAREFKNLRARVRQEIEVVAGELGYNPKYIQYEGAPYKFSVGGTNYTAAADYNPDTRVIRIYNGSVKEFSYTDVEGMQEVLKTRIDVTRSVVAHEIQHDKWNSFMNAAERESAAISDRLTTERMEGVNWRDSFMRPDGSYRNPADADKYKAQDLRSRLLNHTTMDELRRMDGVTGYSASYWTHFDKTKKTGDYYRAVDETLAEVAALRQKGEVTKIAKPWNVLYTEIGKYAEPI